MAAPPSEGPWSDTHNQLAVDAGFLSWEHWCAQLETGKGYLICGARTTAGIPCVHKPMENGRCRWHGGRTPVGIANANWKTGAYSRLFPTVPQKLMEAAGRSYDDPELMSLRKHIALMDARTEELLGQISTGESGRAWKALGQLTVEMRVLMAEEPTPETRAQLTTLQMQMVNLVTEGLGDISLWHEIQDAMENARRLRMTEMDRLKNLRAYIDANRVKSIITRFLAIIKTHVTDPEILTLISRDIVADFQARKQ